MAAATSSFEFEKDTEPIFSETTSSETNINVFQDVHHSEPAAWISPIEAAMVTAVQEAGFIERNIGVEFGMVEQEEILLLHFNRAPKEMVSALSEGIALDQCRTILRENNLPFRLNSGAYIFVEPWQHQLAVTAAEKMLGPHGLKTSHVIVSQGNEYLVAESLDRIGHHVWAKTRHQVPVPMDSMTWVADSECPSVQTQANDERWSDRSVECTIQNTFLCWAPRHRIPAHSGAHTV